MEAYVKFSLIISCLFAVLPLTAQYNIDIDIKNYENDTLIVGYYYADKQLVRDTLYAKQSGKFKLSGEDTLTTGIYILLTSPDKEFIQFNVNEDNKVFGISYDYSSKTDISYTNSEDNTNFQNYLSLLNELRPEAEILRDTIAALTEKGTDASAFKTQLETIDNKVNKYQNNILTNYPNSITAKVLKANKDVELPDFPDTKDGQLKRYLYYKDHFFDNLDLSDPVSMNLGVIQPKIDAYLERLTSNYPDSIIVSLDYLLEEMMPAENTYQYYLGTFLSKYGNSKIIGYDAIYVHLIDNYYAVGKAPWVNEDNLTKIIDNANKIRPALIGKIGADIQVYKEDGKTPISISSIDYEYLVLLFWAPNCSHCTKIMPTVVEFNEKWKNKGIKTFAICTKHQDKTKSCWEALEEKNMLGFINGADQYHRSRFKLKYNVSSTPKVFILNKDREILLKNLGAEHLEGAMLEILKNDNREDLIPK